MAGEIQEAFLSRSAVELIKATWFKGASDDELQLGIAVASRYKLDPVKKQIYFVKRYDQSQGKQVMQAQVSIDGLRLLAERTGKYAGQVGPQWCGKDGQWREVWLEDEPPAAARVGVIRSDWSDTLWAVAKYTSYVALTREGNVTQMWAKFPDVMLAKCAESAALRRAFPTETGGIYTEDEMGQADNSPRSIEDAEVLGESPHRQTPRQQPRPHAAPRPTVPNESDNEPAVEAQIKAIWAIGKKAGHTENRIRGRAFEMFKVEHLHDLTRKQAGELITDLQRAQPAEVVEVAESDVPEAFRNAPEPF